MMIAACLSTSGRIVSGWVLGPVVPGGAEHLMLHLLRVAVMTGLIGMSCGFLFGLLVGWGYRTSVRRLKEPPSRGGTNVVASLGLIACTLLIGPFVAAIYRLVFFRTLQGNAPWVYGVLVTLFLGGWLNWVAWKRKAPGMQILLMINTGGAILLGWLIPLLFDLLVG